MLNTIHHDTCENFMSTMEDNSVDLVVTDPPYEFVVNNPNGAGFMKDRDYIKTINNTFGMTYNPDQYLNECKRILKKFNGYFWTNKNLLKNYIEFIEKVLGFGGSDAFSYFQFGVSLELKKQIEDLINNQKLFE